MIRRLEGVAAVAESAAIAHLLAAAFDDPAQRWTADSLASTLSVPGCLALVATDGCAVLRVAGGEAELLTIAVAPDARRRGVGRALLDRCLAVASTAGAERLHLEVGAANAAAVALYASAGFARTGRRRGYYVRPGGREDALLMSRAIPQ